MYCWLDKQIWNIIIWNESGGWTLNTGRIWSNEHKKTWSDFSAQFLSRETYCCCCCSCCDFHQRSVLFDSGTHHQKMLHEQFHQVTNGLLFKRAVHFLGRIEVTPFTNISCILGWIFLISFKKIWPSSDWVHFSILGRQGCQFGILNYAKFGQTTKEATKYCLASLGR